MDEKGLARVVPHVLKHSLHSWLVTQSHLQQLIAPSRDAAFDGELAQVGRRDFAVGRVPDILHALDGRVGRLVALSVAAQVEDGPDVLGEPGHGLRIFGGHLEGARAVQSAGWDDAAGNGAGVAHVDERAAGDEGGLAENREQRLLGDGLADVGGREGENLVASRRGHDDGGGGVEV